MPQLPFVIAPKRETRIVSAEVNGEICSLEFPVFGSILAGEAVAIRDHQYQAAVYRESARLADALVAEDFTELEAQRQAIRILSSRMGVPVPLEAAEQRTMLRHADLIADLQTKLSNEYTQQVLRTVTAAIANRLPGCQEWSEADTATLPEPLQVAIAAFIDTERNAKTPERTPEELIEDMVETLGKLGPEDPSLSPPTGATPIGAVDDSGPMPQNSAESVLQPSLSVTSPKRSKKASVG